MKPIRKSTLVALLLCCVSVSGQTTQEWRDSLAKLNQAIAAHPKSTDLRLKKAAVNIQLSQWEYAVEEYGNVLRIQPQNLAALYYRAYAQTTLRQYGLAKADYEAFLQIAPIHLEARLGLANVLERMGRMTDAGDELNRIVQMFPDSAVAYAARALFEGSQKHYDPALYDWTEAIRLAPANIDYVVSKVELLLQLGRKSEARQELNEAIRRGEPRYALKEWMDRCR